MEIIGTATNDFAVKRMELKSVLETDMIRGSIIYVDRYGNAITNINNTIKDTLVLLNILII